MMADRRQRITEAFSTARHYHRHALVQRHTALDTRLRLRFAPAEILGRDIDDAVGVHQIVRRIQDIAVGEFGALGSGCELIVRCPAYGLHGLDI
jgi:hypothetical protein